MFIGHYGPSFAIKALDTRLPLWLLFLAVQLVDIVWAALVLAGVEHVRIVPGITATNPLDLYYMPYTHSLIAALVWAAAAGAAWRIGPGVRGRRAAVLLLALAVFSHWLLDLLVHRPDLPLYDDTLKVGLGLWDFPALAFALEAGLLFGGMYFYLRVTRPAARGGAPGLVAFGLVMLALQAAVFFGPPPASTRQLALTALFSYFGFAVVAGWLERKRLPPAPQGTA